MQTEAHRIVSCSHSDLLAGGTACETDNLTAKTSKVSKPARQSNWPAGFLFSGVFLIGEGTGPMTRVVTESTAAVGGINAKRSDPQQKRERVPGDSSVIDSLEAILRPEEKELLRELVQDASHDSLRLHRSCDARRPPCRDQ